MGPNPVLVYILERFSILILKAKMCSLSLDFADLIFCKSVDLLFQTRLRAHFEKFCRKMIRLFFNILQELHYDSIKRFLNSKCCKYLHHLFRAFQKFTGSLEPMEHVVTAPLYCTLNGVHFILCL